MPKLKKDHFNFARSCMPELPQFSGWKIAKLYCDHIWRKTKYLQCKFQFQENILNELTGI